ncbi:MAG: cell division protein ZapA [Proteobacteria bacterium]|nr:cell division protein ZapA [Pseudomonadota bacterium]
MANQKLITTPRHSYRGLPITYEQFKDLLLLALTMRNADGSGEAPWDLEKTAARADLSYEKGWIEKFAQDMEHPILDFIATDKVPEKELCAYPNSAAFAVAPYLLEKYFGDPDFDHPFDEKPELTGPFEGIGRVDVTFLGRNLTIGCVEDEEERTKHLVERIEAAAGETLKAVTGPLDDFRALLMGSVLLVEVIEDLEDQSSVPASDRIVTLNHNSPDYREAIKAIGQVTETIAADNEYGAEAPEEKEALLGALKSGRLLLSATQVRVSAVRATLLPALQYIADNFAKGAVAALGATAVAAVLKLIGVF